MPRLKRIVARKPSSSYVLVSGGTAPSEDCHMDAPQLAWDDEQ